MPLSTFKFIGTDCNGKEKRDDKDFTVGGKTKLELSQQYWEKDHLQTRFKRINNIEELNRIQDLKEKQNIVNQELNKLETHILQSFNSIDPEKVTKEWLQKVINNYYGPRKVKEEKREDLTLYLTWKSI